MSWSPALHPSNYKPRCPSVRARRVANRNHLARLRKDFFLDSWPIAKGVFLTGSGCVVQINFTNARLQPVTFYLAGQVIKAVMAGSASAQLCCLFFFVPHGAGVLATSNTRVPRGSSIISCLRSRFLNPGIDRIGSLRVHM